MGRKRSRGFVHAAHRHDLEQAVDSVEPARQHRPGQVAARGMTGDDDAIVPSNSVDNLEDGCQHVIVRLDPRFPARRSAAGQVEIHAMPARTTYEERFEIVGRDLPWIGPTGQHEKVPSLSELFVVHRYSFEMTVDGTPP